MDKEKIFADFEKHFSRKCENICFAGMPIMILRGRNTVLSASVSVGGYAAVSRRADGRIVVEADNNKKYVSANVLDLDYHKEEPMLDFFARVKKGGTKLGGADILLGYNTGIYNGYEPLLLTCMYFFCTKMPEISKIKKYLSNPETDFVSLSGVRDTVLFQGEKCRYIKFCNSAVKIVICSIAGKNHMEKCEDSTLETASRLLASGDYEGFGKIVTEEYKAQAGKRGISKKSKYLFELSVNLRDGIGYGILENGGIFALVEDKKVNAFIQNLKKEYETYYGAPPDFYVTRTENSGMNKIQ